MALQLFTVMYGENPQYQLELFGSVVSALGQSKKPDQLHITVFSDRDHIEGFPVAVNVRKFDPEKWAQWTYAGKATHFIKMHLMADMLAEFSDPVLYFDTDVIFLKDPLKIASRIDAANTLMQADEGPLHKHYLWDGLTASLRTAKNPLASLINSQSRMYNSGVMGMLPEHRPMMLEAIELAHKIYQLENIFSIDQLATAVSLRRSTHLHTCANEVHHYWGWVRPFIHRHLEILKKDYQRYRLNPSQIRGKLEQLTSVPVIDPRDRLKVRLARLRGKKANAFAHLAYLTAIRQSAKSPAEANLWLDTCLSTIHQAITTTPTIAPGVRYLVDAIDANSEWLTPKTRGRLQSIMLQVNEHLPEKQDMTA